MDKPTYKARWIPARFGVNCCAPGCGDKIKPLDSDDTMVEIVDFPRKGEFGYLEHYGCVDWFENGHPDLGCARGKLIWEDSNETIN